ncbi:hypothetical protein L7F22_025864 [Adiantum nelumboides]|nr:hypothetical protein [Adiantum nelumboides]
MRRAREEVQEESYSTQAATPIADVSGGQEDGCSSTPGASSHMGESRSAPPIVSSQIHAHVSKKYKQHVAPHLQTTLASRFAPKLKKDAEIAEQQFFYQCNLAFRICSLAGLSSKDDLVQLWNERFDWFHKPIQIVTYMLHPLYKKLSHWNDRKLIEAWTRYIEIVYATDDCSLLSTSQLDKLVYVNANLRLLERLRLRDGNGEGVLQWKVKDIDASVIANLEHGLARGEAIDITFIQQRSDEDLAYDFLREEQTRFRRVTRAQARALQLPTEPSTMDAGFGPSTRGRSALARGGRRGRGGRATSSLVIREMMPSDESASSSSSTHSGMDAASDSDFVSELSFDLNGETESFSNHEEEKTGPNVDQNKDHTKEHEQKQVPDSRRYPDEDDLNKDMDVEDVEDEAQANLDKKAEVEMLMEHMEIYARDPKYVKHIRSPSLDRVVQGWKAHNPHFGARKHELLGSAKADKSHTKSKVYGETSSV